MAPITIGFISFKPDPLIGIVPLRLRALQAEASLQGAMFVQLDWRDFDGSSDQVLTWFWTGDDWQSVRRDLPDVVIIGGPPRSDLQRELMELVHETRPFVHDIGITKLALTELLEGTAQEKYLIPHQQVAAEEGEAVIESFLQTHGSAVVKRTNGNQGVGLNFVLERPTGWCIHGDDKGENRSRAEVASQMFNRIKGRLAYRDFVIQKYVKSVTSDGRPIDIRVHVQRDASHAWVVTRAYVRLAVAGSMVTNTSRGGYQGPLQGFLENRTGCDAAAVEAEMLQASMDIAEMQSRIAPHGLSELGLDFMLDENHRMWLLETNALPQSFFHEHARAITMISYAVSLHRSAAGK